MQRDAAFVIVAGMGSAVLLAVTQPMERLNKWLYRLIRQPWRWHRQLAIWQFAWLTLWNRI